MKDDTRRRIVRENYSKIAKEDSCCGNRNFSSCERSGRREAVSRQVGYSQDEIESAPERANLGLGCGNPIALASLKEGQTVLDLGSGAGLDCFLASRKVGVSGHVIGVDMTPEMIDRAREAMKRNEYCNIEFRLGEIENLPVADGTVDVVISNCVINLSSNKERVLKETHRALKPGGKFVISDIVLLEMLSETIKNNIEGYVGCLSGAIMKDDFVDLIEQVGFDDVRIVEENHFPIRYLYDSPFAIVDINDSNSSLNDTELGHLVASITVFGTKPNQ
jgi:arsenite methyltransferase